MIAYRDADFEVHTGFFTGLKVIDLERGVKIVPERRLRDLLNLTWPKVRKSKIAEALLFRKFCEAAAEPLSFHAALLVRSAPDELARDIYNEIEGEVEKGVVERMAEVDRKRK